MGVLRLLTANIFMVLVCLGAASAADAPVSTLDAVRPVVLTDAGISPSGDKLAYSHFVAVPSSLRVIDLNTNKYLYEEEFESERIYHVVWYDDDVLLVAARRWTSRVNDKMDTGSWNLYSISMSTGNKKLLAGGRGSFGVVRDTFSAGIRISDARPGMITVVGWNGSQNLGITDVDVRTGKRNRRVSSNMTTDYILMDREGGALLRLNFKRRGYVGRALSFVQLYTPKENGDWEFLEEIPVETDDEFSQNFPYTYGPEAGSVLTRERAPEDEFYSLKYRQPGAEKSELFVETSGGSARGIVVDKLTGEPLCARYGAFGKGLVCRDENLTNEIEAIRQYFGEPANIKLRSASRDRNELVLSVSAPWKPDHLYVWNRDARQLREISPELLGYSERAPETYEAFEAKSVDGFGVSGTIIHPVGVRPDQFAPLIVRFITWQDGYFGSEFDREAQYFAARGYRVMSVNVRGHGAKGRTEERAANGHWQDLVLDDAYAALKLAYGRGLAVPERTCLMGREFGGYIALMLQVRAPSSYACAAVNEPMIDLAGYKVVLEQNYQESDSYRDDLIAFFAGDGEVDLEAASPYYLTELLTVPTFGVYRGYDLHDSFDYGRLAQRANRNGGNFTELKFTDARGTGLTGAQRKYDTLEAFETFFAAQLLGQQN